MSLLTDLKASIVKVGLGLRDLHARVNNIEMQIVVNQSSSTRSNRDVTGQYTTVTWKRVNNTLACVSTLSNVDADTQLYGTRTVVYYKKDGTTLTRTIVFTLVYDSSGMLISETIASDVSI